MKSTTNALMSQSCAFVSSDEQQHQLLNETKYVKHLDESALHNESHDGMPVIDANEEPPAATAVIKNKTAIALVTAATQQPEQIFASQTIKDEGNPNQSDEMAVVSPSYSAKNINLHVSNLCPEVTEKQLYHWFAPFGTIVRHKLVMDVNTGYCRGYGFVLFEDEADAAEALKAMNGRTPLPLGGVQNATAVADAPTSTKKLPASARDDCLNAPPCLSPLTEGSDLPGKTSHSGHDGHVDGCEPKVMTDASDNEVEAGTLSTRTVSSWNTTTETNVVAVQSEPITVQWSRNHQWESLNKAIKSFVDSDTVYIRNLPGDVSHNEALQLMFQFGDVAGFKTVPVPKSPIKGLRMASVQFSGGVDVARRAAAALHGTRPWGDERCPIVLLAKVAQINLNKVQCTNAQRNSHNHVQATRSDCAATPTCEKKKSKTKHKESIHHDSISSQQEIDCSLSNTINVTHCNADVLSPPHTTSSEDPSIEPVLVKNSTIENRNGATGSDGVSGELGVQTGGGGMSSTDSRGKKNRLQRHRQSDLLPPLSPTRKDSNTTSATHHQSPTLMSRTTSQYGISFRDKYSEHNGVDAGTGSLGNGGGAGAYSPRDVSSKNGRLVWFQGLLQQRHDGTCDIVKSHVLKYVEPSGPQSAGYGDGDSAPCSCNTTNYSSPATPSHNYHTAGGVGGDTPMMMSSSHEHSPYVDPYKNNNNNNNNYTHYTNNNNLNNNCNTSNSFHHNSGYNMSGYANGSSGLYSKGSNHGTYQSKYPDRTQHNPYLDHVIGGSGGDLTSHNANVGAGGAGVSVGVDGGASGEKGGAAAYGDVHYSTNYASMTAQYPQQHDSDAQYQQHQHSSSGRTYNNNNNYSMYVEKPNYNSHQHQAHNRSFAANSSSSNANYSY